MPLIDDRARLFGRINLIDALVGLFVLALIPLAYGAYLLFRVPVPTLTSVEPQQVVERGNATVKINGQNMRPFLHAKLGTTESGGLFVQSPTLAEIKVPVELPPGTYDLTLFNEGQELVRKAGALTVIPAQAPVPPPPPPQMEVQAVGEFVGLSKDDVRMFQVGTRFEKDPALLVAQVLAVLPAEPGVQRVRVGGNAIVATPIADKLQVPAIIRLNCVFGNEQCKVDDTVVTQSATVTLPVSGTRGPGAAGRTPAPGQQVKFVIEEVRPANAPVTFGLTAPALELQALGDFVGVAKEDLPLIRVGAVFERRKDPAALQAGRNASGELEKLAEVLAVRAPEPGLERVRVSGNVVTTPLSRDLQVPAIVRLSCRMTNEQCKVGDTVVAQDATMTLPLPSRPPDSRRAAGQVRFVIREVRSADARVAFPSVSTAVATVRVHFLARQEIAGQVKVGDTDVSSAGSGAESARASLTAIDAQRETVMATVIVNSTQFPQTMVAFDATVRVPVVLGRDAWTYEGRAVKAGVGFSFDAMSYSMTGTILDVKLGPVTEASAR